METEIKLKTETEEEIQREEESVDLLCVPADGEEEKEEKEEKTVKKRLNLFGVELNYLCFLAIVTAFLGWLAENFVRLVTRGIIDSRFHVLPFIPVYGLIVFAAQILFSNPSDWHFFGKRVFKNSSKKTKILSNVCCLLVMYAAVFFGELIVGNGWELISGVQLWDYSQMPLSVTQYAGLIPMVGYGTGAYLLLRFCFSPAVRFLQTKANYKVIFILTLIFSILLTLDEIAMLVQFIAFGETPVYWQIQLW